MATITIMGLGTDDTQSLTEKAKLQLHSGQKIVLRTNCCGAAYYLKQNNIPYTSMDALYEEAEDFNTLESSIAQAILDLSKDEPITYAVPGSAVYGDGTVDKLLSMCDDVTMISGISSEMDNLANANVQGVSSGFTMIPAAMLTQGTFSPRLPLFITALNDAYTLSELKLMLSTTYGDEHGVTLIHNGEAKDRQLYELDRIQDVDHTSCLLVPPKTDIARYDFQDLMEVFQRLRSPNGCPWDKEQTHESLKRYLMEETAEALDAIDSGDMAAVCDEMGDVLLQVAFHGQIASERGDFDLIDICDNLCRKLIDRHPHIFSDRIADTAEDVKKTWDAIKKAKRKDKSEATIMSEVPRHLSALLRADKVQQRAAKVGFDWEDANGALDKLKEEIEEALTAYRQGDTDHAAHELGDVLFATVNVCRLMGVESEFALDATTQKFISRFAYVEAIAKSQGQKT